MRTHRRFPLGAIALAAALLAGAVLAQGAAAAVYAYPSPGTTTAEPYTQISFRGIAAGSVQDVTVTGSRSGAHPGHVVAHSDGQGASFMADQRFASGETVTVHTPFAVTGGSGNSYSFTTAPPAGGIRPIARPNVPGPVARFRTRPDLVPAAIQILRGKGRAGDDIFVASQYGPVQAGAAVYAPDGTLLWYRRAAAQNWITDFRAQTYLGQPVLTWWEGYVNRGTGSGHGVIYDQRYRQIATVNGGNRLPADLHEFLLTDHNTALITATYPTVRSLSSVHGARTGIVFDAVVQEIDVRTGLVEFEWHSLDHVPLSDSYVPPPKSNGHVFDYFHVNSVGYDRDGNLIISSRNTWGIYKVDAHTGSVIWTLGGKRSSFRLGPNVHFAWQHDARVRSDGAITLFDDEAAPKIGTQSRAIAVRLDTAAKTATLVGRAVHGPALVSAYEGNAQNLANGNVFVGWGQNPYFTLFDSRGRTIMDGRFLAPTPSYRAYLLPWSGDPQTKPVIAPIQTSSHTVTTFVSWNGATAVARWRILAGPSASGPFHVVRTAAKQHFETAVHATTGEPYLQAEGLDASGRVLATSAAIHRR